MSDLSEIEFFLKHWNNKASSDLAEYCANKYYYWGLKYKEAILKGNYTLLVLKNKDTYLKKFMELGKSFSDLKNIKDKIYHELSLNNTMDNFWD